jgi:arylamine N-acetyltransferase
MTIPSVFSEDELSDFLQYIGFPPSLQKQRYSGDAAKDLHLLTQLMTYTISAVPYENLWLHYNPAHSNSIKPRETYSNIVTNGRGRGGYCFQVSIFFNHMLRALGFPAYLSPVRIRPRVDGIPQGDYGGWVHLVNLVTLSDGSKWAVDVGFGGDGPTAPIQLVHGYVRTNLGSQETRLWHDWIPTQLHRTDATKLWIYQYRNNPQQDWNAFYAFSEAEAMEADFRNLNWYTGSHPESFQTFTCIIVKFLRRSKSDAKGEEEDQEIYGKRMLINGVVKENLGGKTAVMEDCRTEEQRLAALDKWFGMSFTQDERDGIRGWGTELRGDGSEGVIARQGQVAEKWKFRRGKDWMREWQRPVEGET